MKKETEDIFKNVLTKHTKFIDGEQYYVFTKLGMVKFLQLIKEYLLDDD